MTFAGWSAARPSVSPPGKAVAEVVPRVGSVGVGSTVVNAVDKVLNLEFCFVGSDSSTPVELPAFSLTIFDIDHEGVEGATDFQTIQRLKGDSFDHERVYSSDHAAYVLHPTSLVDATVCNVADCGE